MESYDDMHDDPLDAAFANPKAGKKVKAGEALPGLEMSSTATFDRLVEPDAKLSRALDDAFSNPDFGKAPSKPAPQPGAVGPTEAELAQSINDAFANPKAGKKIPDDQAAGALSGAHGAGDLDLTYRGTSLDGLDAKRSGGLMSPKVLVIGMVVLAVVLIAVSMGQGTEAAPTVIRLDN